MDRLFCMQVFVRVVEHGAFARAADALGISRASATTAVAKLERRLGVRLLNRTTRRLSITDDGRAYYEDCLRILDEVAESEDNLSSTRVSPRGKLRVTVPQSFVNTLFFPALMRFMKTYPQLCVEIFMTDRAVNLVEEGIDCGIRGSEVPLDSGLVARKLSETRWLTCASPAYLAGRATPRQIEDLAQHECIRFVSPSTGRAFDWEFAEREKSVNFAPSGNLRLTSLEAVTEAAIAGGGIAQVPDALAFRGVQSGLLVPLLTDKVALAPPLVIVYPGNRYLTAKVRAFTDFFLGIFPREGWWPTITAAEALPQPD